MALALCLGSGRRTQLLQPGEHPALEIRLARLGMLPAQPLAYHPLGEVAELESIFESGRCVLRHGPIVAWHQAIDAARYALEQRPRALLPLDYPARSWPGGARPSVRQGQARYPSRPESRMMLAWPS